MNEADWNSDEAEEQFLERAGAAMLERREAIDASTLSRLNRARHRALEEFGGRRSVPGWFGVRWAPALGVTAAVLLAAGVWLGLPGESGLREVPQRVVVELPVANPDSAALDLDVLLAEDNLEMLEELEFFNWFDADLFDETVIDASGTVG